jgi:outer membrane protein TolC
VNWTLDPSTYHAAKAQRTAQTLAEIRADRARVNARDNIHSAWQAVRAELSKVTAARAEAQASKHAAELARERYQAGSATQLDVQQAERDSFGSEVSQIQAEADLAYARLALRIAVGSPPLRSEEQ